MSQHCWWESHGDYCECPNCFERMIAEDGERRAYEREAERQYANQLLEEQYNRECRDGYLTQYLMDGGASVDAEWAKAHFPPGITNEDLKSCAGEVSGPWLHRGKVYYRLKWVEEAARRRPG